MQVAEPSQSGLATTPLEGQAPARQLGSFIVLEGCDCSGKSTHQQLLAEALASEGHVVQQLRGLDRSTDSGKRLSAFLKGELQLEFDEEVRLFAANLAERQPIIEAALKRGEVVVMDRYIYSHIAYASARGADVSECQKMHDGSRHPDAVLFMDLSPEECAKRSGFGSERFEKLELQQKVYQEFMRLASEEPWWVMINTRNAKEEVASRVASEVRKRLVSAWDLTGMCVAERVARIARRAGEGKRLDLNNPHEFGAMWSALTAELKAQPLFPEAVSQSFEREAHLMLKLGNEGFAHEERTETPAKRPASRTGPPLDMDSDYVTLAVACQLVLHLPECVCHVHNFEQLYGGRIITDIIPELGDHTTFDGTIRRSDHMVKEKAMRLHVDDADHLLRARVQLLTGVKNKRRTATTFATMPPDAVLRELGCDIDTLRQPCYRHEPPKIFPWSPEEVSRRPVLFGPEASPMIQADHKAIKPVDEAAELAWQGLHTALKGKFLRAAVVGTGDVLVLDGYRTIHGREEIEPVECVADRRWVKRLWLSATATDGLLRECGGASHPRVFDRKLAFETTPLQLHPPVM